MEDNRFEKNVAEEMGSFKLKPSDTVWQQVDAQLKEDRKRRRWVFIFLFAGFLLGGAGLLSVIANKDEHPSVVVHPPIDAVTSVESKMNKAEHRNTLIVNEQPVARKAEKNTIAAPASPIAAIKMKQTILHVRQPGTIVSFKKNSKPVTQPQAVTSAPVAQYKQQNEWLITQEDKPVAYTEAQNEKIVAEPTAENKSTTVITTAAVTVNDSLEKAAHLITTAATKVPADSLPKSKSKWLLGLQINTGMAQIRDNVLPGAMSLSADASPLFGNNGPAGTVGPTRITVNQFAIKPSLQFGMGAVLRKTIFKRHAFVTGLQYQYSSYTVLQKQRVDSFLQTVSSFSTVMRSESNTRFVIHSIAVPLDIEWRIASAANGMFRMGTGVQQWFRIASAQQGDLSSAFRYSNTAAGPVKAVTWQPVLQLTPLYEWTTKKYTSQLGLYFNYGLRPVYRTAANAKDYWWQTGLRYRFYFAK